MCHYPMLSYPQARRGYMIYGHIHNNTGDDYWPLIMRRPRMLNAGVDVIWRGLRDGDGRRRPGRQNIPKQKARSDWNAFSLCLARVAGFEPATN